MPHLEFHGKQSVYAHHLSVPYRTLDIVRNKSILPRGAAAEEGNLIVHGDNLHALKALMPRYAGRVNCIYIDPPYNTGKEGWCYNDNVNSGLMQRWLQENGAVDGEDEERHEKWLCMMWPRLQLLHELLTEDGVIFISIDDHEQHRLRMMMDDIFGEENFRNTLIVKRGAKNVQSQFETIDRLNYGHEYIHVYTKDPEFRFQQFREATEEKRGGSWNNHWRGTDRPTMRYEIFGITPEHGQWRWSQQQSAKAIENYKRMLEELGKNEKTITQEEIDSWFESQEDENLKMLRLSQTGKPEHYVPPSNGHIISSLWTDISSGSGGVVDKLLETRRAFDNPKRVELIKRIVNFSCGNNLNAIVLDSFAGSGTTAHAVLGLNKEDGGNRKFILVECEDYADEITAERVRRVINGVPNAKNGALKAGLGGTFAFCKLGRELDIEKILTGEDLPDYDALARHVSYTATGAALESIESGADHFFGENATHRMHMIYRPDVDFLCSNESAITRELAQRIGAAAKKAGKTALVFAPWKFISQKELTQNGVTFCQLPYAIHRMFGNSLGE